MFLLVGFVFLDYKPSFTIIINEFTAIDPNIMKFCWYVLFYTMVMLILPIYVKFVTNKPIIDFSISVLFVPSFLKFVSFFIYNDNVLSHLTDFQRWFPSVSIGYLCAFYDIFNKAEELIKTHKLFKISTCIILLFFSFFARRYPRFDFFYIFELNFDAIYSSLFTYSLATIINTYKFKYLNKLMTLIGKYSMFMWFVSCGFFNNCESLFKPILYCTNNPFIILIIGILMCLIPSIFLQKIASKFK